MKPWKLLSGVTLVVVACGTPRPRSMEDAPPPPRDMTIRVEYDIAYTPGSEDLRGMYNADAACAMGDATAKPAKRPVDLIMVIDNSGSMQDEIRSVQDNINGSL